MTLMAEALSPGIARRTDVLLYDERQLSEELQLVTFDRISLSDSLYIRYRYDVNSQRIIKRIRETANGPDVVFERYVRDGNRLVGVFGENNELKNWNIGGAAGLVGRADPATLGFTRRYYVTDHLGSIRAVVDQAGTVIEGRDYYPYGLTMPGRFYVQADTTREGFTGHELDKETGLYYAGARFYGSALGRWFVPDPLAEAYPGFSPYNYVLGNPLSLIDLDGMSVDNDYQLLRDGTITLTRETDDKFDTLFASDDAGNILQNTYTTVERGILDNITTRTVPDGDFSYMSTNSDKTATILFEFLSNNSLVEWSFIQHGESGNYLSTSYKIDYDYSFRHLMIDLNAAGVMVREYTHSHPVSTVGYPSGFHTTNTVGTDREVAASLPNYFPGIILRVYEVPTQKYIRYTSAYYYTEK